MIGVFGGTFDPVHYGHMRAVLELNAVFNLSQMRVVLCARPAHREQPKAGVHHRLEMLRIALAYQPHLILDDQECQREGPSYTVDTLSALRMAYPAMPLLLFVGSDAFSGFEGWHRWQYIVELAHIVVVNRPASTRLTVGSYFESRITNNALHLKENLAGYVFFQDVTALTISSTAIRHMIATGQDPSYLLPDAVLAYVNDAGLYQR
jgi:nicotinate-nucleotide adenylyltransferase